MERRAAIAALLLGCAAGAALAQPGTAGKSPPLAIKGYDPVAYFTAGRPVKGDASIAYDFDDSRYYFSSAKNRELFAANPDRYAPQFAGLCAAGLADGRKVQPDPNAFVIHEGKLYLFEASRGVERVKKDPSLISKAHQAYQKK
jgi:YHS domain-containing protein